MLIAEEEEEEEDEVVVVMVSQLTRPTNRRVAIVSLGSLGSFCLQQTTRGDLMSCLIVDIDSASDVCKVGVASAFSEDDKFLCSLIRLVLLLSFVL